jgi:hypothetical protein
MGLLVAGTKYRGEFEERLKKLMDEIKQNDDIILVGGRWVLRGRGQRRRGGREGAECSCTPSLPNLHHPIPTPHR